MSPPYRSALTPESAHAPRDQGIVGDIIEQFADPYAFLRELVQNAIDASTPSIAVALTYDEAARAVKVAVRDRGAGMSRDVLENRLLVLFRSTKEHDDDKIGKFGVGFASVLAMQPTLIRVDSVHGGTRHVLHLYPDLRYELFDAGRANATGTSVELEVPLAPDQLAGFVDTCADALEQWCRHATVPIDFFAADAGGNELARRRIDRPLAIHDALAQAQATCPNGLTTAVVGIPANGAPYVGFFNHGLTLHESDEPLFGNLAVKIQDRRLGHTLSRDNVRRDDELDRAVAFARKVARLELPKAAASALREAAEARDGARFIAISDGVLAARVDIPARHWWFPLTDPVGDICAIDGERFATAGGWIADGSSPLTRALARSGVPVVDLGAAGRVRVRRFAADIESICSVRVRDAHAQLVLIAPIQPTDPDLVLLDHVRAALDRAHREPSGIAIAHLAGVYSTEIAIAGTHPNADATAAAEDGPPAYVLSHTDARADPFKLVSRPPLVLNARSVHVQRARARAELDPVAAANLLARAILLSRDKLDDDRSEDLLEHGLAALEGELP